MCRCPKAERDVWSCGKGHRKEKAPANRGLRRLLTIGGGTGRSLATAAGAVAGGVAGQGVQGAMNKTQGVELEIRKDDGSTIMVVQKQGNTRFSAGQRVVLASNGSQVTVSPR